jgi:predicted Zn-dependent protease
MTTWRFLDSGGASLGMTKTLLIGAMALVVTTAGCAVDEDQEKSIGQQAAAEIDAQVPLINDAAINSYLTEFGTTLASRSDDRKRDWRFRVVDSDVINAFALPGGFVYVNRGLIERAATSSELAGVLGHEISHVLLRHSAERLEKAQKTNVGISIVCGFTNICSSDAARVAINVGGAALFAKFSRKDELEADSAAVGVLIRAGYDPNGIATMFEKLLRTREQRPDMVAGWFASHPLEETRIRAVENVIRSAAPAQSSQLVKDDPTFHEFQNHVRALPPSPPSPAMPVP